MAQMAQKRLKGFDCCKVAVFVKWEGSYTRPDVKYKLGIDKVLIMEECVLLAIKQPQKIYIKEM